MNQVKQTFSNRTNTVLRNSPPRDIIKTKRTTVRCPVCKKGPVLYLLPTTEVKDLPVKCKKCGAESVINISPVPVP